MIDTHILTDSPPQSHDVWYSGHVTFRGLYLLCRTSCYQAWLETSPTHVRLTLGRTLKPAILSVISSSFPLTIRSTLELLNKLLLPWIPLIEWQLLWLLLNDSYCGCCLHFCCHGYLYRYDNYGYCLQTLWLPWLLSWIHYCHHGYLLQILLYDQCSIK